MIREWKAFSDRIRDEECLPNSSGLNRWHVEECVWDCVPTLPVVDGSCQAVAAWAMGTVTGVRCPACVSTRHCAQYLWPKGQLSTCHTLRGRRGHAQTYTHMYSALFELLNWQGYIIRESYWHGTHVSIGLQCVQPIAEQVWCQLQALESLGATDLCSWHGLNLGAYLGKLLQISVCLEKWQPWFCL